MKPSELKHEKEIVIKTQSDLRHFTELYEMYFEKIYRYLYRKTQRQETAEDLTQQTFLNALQNFNSYHIQEGASFGSWLFRIAHNLLVSEYRQKKPASLDTIEDHSIEGEREVIEVVDKSIDAEKLMRCMSELPPNYKEVVDLKKEGLKVKDIADILEKTESAIKVNFFRAVKMLRDCLQGIMG
jgi:RNA polymerase sigma-70 factor (ECF subfamily)